MLRGINKPSQLFKYSKVNYIEKSEADMPRTNIGNFMELQRDKMIWLIVVDVNGGF